MRHVAVLALVILTAFAARAETWKVVSEEEYPPYNFVENGKKTGIDTEIVYAVLKEIGVEPDHEGVPWNRVVTMLDQNQTDIGFQFIGSAERMEKYHLVGPHRIGHTVFAAPIDSSVTYDTLEDLKGKTIGLVQGFTYSKSFDGATFLSKDLSATNNEILVKKLAAKRYDLIIGDFDTLNFLAIRNHLSAQIRFLPKTHEDVPRYIAFPKERGDKAERFRQGLEAVKARGEIDAILKRWADRKPTSGAGDWPAGTGSLASAAR